MERNTNNNHRLFRAFGENNSWDDPYRTWTLPVEQDQQIHHSNGSFQQDNTTHSEQLQDSTGHKNGGVEGSSERFNARRSQPSDTMSATCLSSHTRMATSSHQRQENQLSGHPRLAVRPGASSSFDMEQARTNDARHRASDSREDPQYYRNMPSQAHNSEAENPAQYGYGSSYVDESTPVPYPTQQQGYYYTTNVPSMSNTHFSGSPNYGQSTQHDPENDGFMVDQAILRPSKMAQDAQSLAGTFGQREVLRKNHYLGDANNLKVTNLEPSKNTALFLTNIEDGCQPWQVFDKIRVGKVSALHLRPKAKDFSTIAATLIFATPEGARLFLRENITIMGRTIQMRYNRDGYLEDPKIKTHDQSRVLRIEGPEHIMFENWWNDYFNKFCSFTWDRIEFVQCPREGRRMMDFRFVRIEAQSRMCLKGILDDQTGIMKELGVEACYGPDPCDPTVSSNFG